MPARRATSASTCLLARVVRQAVALDRPAVARGRARASPRACRSSCASASSRRTARIRGRPRWQAPSRGAPGPPRAAGSSARCDADAIARSRSSRSCTRARERQGLDRLRGRAHERDEVRIPGGRDDLAVPDGHGVHAVLGLDGLAAEHRYPDRLSHEETLSARTARNGGVAARARRPGLGLPDREGRPRAHRDAEDLRSAAVRARGPAPRGSRAAREAASVPDRGRRARPARAPDDRGAPAVRARGREAAQDAGVQARLRGRRGADPDRGREEEARGRLAARRPRPSSSSSVTSGRRRTRSTRPSWARSSRASRGACTRCSATSA